MHCSILDGDDHCGLIRISLGVYRDLPGYPWNLDRIL
jgi:hypothetical protein